uniref:Uncharacterized protein n=1 Tax=Amphimedon queenslandica TaxID=400682 RepID=A0A1X7TLC4_AMPQE
PFTNTATSTISSTHINTVTTVLPSSSIYSTATVTMESMKCTKTSLTSSTTSVMSTPVSTLQSTGSNTLILAGTISTAVFILLVVTILVILIVSVLVCRRIWDKTSNGNDTFSSTVRKADINQQSEVPNMENTLWASTNPAYGVTGESKIDYYYQSIQLLIESGVSANPAYGINTGGIQIILLCFMSNGMLLEANGESCTEGFMDYSLLQDKARNPLGSLRNNRLAENTATRWIIIEDQEDENFMKRDIMFTCATVVLEILIGVDIRTVNDTVGRNLYPKFEVWAPTNDDDVYTREMSIEIRLTPDNFTTNGQYHFTLPTPLNVSSGYRIGVYQPPDHRSVVRFHYINLPSGIDGIGKVKSGRINDTNIKIAGGSKNVDHKTWYILIYPLAQNTSCFTQPMPENMNNFVSMITNSRFLYDTRIFPDIK